MRLNQPVTHREYQYSPDQTMVSTTDTKGRILYVNPSFIEVSGFTREELLGQPHNMIRHPDMPAEAFRDMWATVQNGHPWSALVKNRRKCGDHYWVRANVTPLIRHGQPVAYLSVRTAPTREQVQAAETLYRTMREEAAQGTLIHRLHHGAVVSGRPLDRLARLARPGTQTALSMIIGGAGAGGVATAALLAPSTHPWAWVLLALAFGFAAAALGGWAAGRLTLAPLVTLLARANRMAAGDLTQRITAQGQGMLAHCAQALAQLNVNLQSIVRDARGEAQRMRDASREIASGNEDLSNRTESQAANLQKTASALEEITGTARQSSEVAAKAAAIAVETTQAAQRSQTVVDDVGVTMQDIKAYSTRIREIIGVIDSIAFQTNILALNAAVEAARAGEQGRGFAVVASEVRALSQRTSTAAKEITQLIQSSGDRIDSGARLAETARSTMHDAVARVQSLDGLIAEISHATQEQLVGIAEISDAVQHLDGLTQQNAALVEQVAASAQALHAQAQVMTDTMGIFHLDDTASDDPRPDAVTLRRAMKTA